MCSIVVNVQQQCQDAFCNDNVMLHFQCHGFNMFFFQICSIQTKCHLNSSLPRAMYAYCTSNFWQLQPETILHKLANVESHLRIGQPIAHTLLYFTCSSSADAILVQYVV